MEKEQVIEITDRYKALGIPYPDVKTMCKGQCEGTGYIPHLRHLGGFDGLKTLATEQDAVFDELWDEAHNKHTGTQEGDLCDGWHFIKCPDCKGTGKI